MKVTLHKWNALIQDGEKRIVIELTRAYMGGVRIDAIHPAHAELIPEGHPSKFCADRMSRQWNEYREEALSGGHR